MISKSLLRKRLSVAIGENIPPATFTWFFRCFCESVSQPQLKNTKELTTEEVNAFSRYAGYDLKFPIPLPLW